MGRKCGSQEPNVVLHSLYMQILPINLIFSLEWYYTKSQIFSHYWSELSLIRDELGLNWEKSDFQEPKVVLHSFYV